MSQITAVSTLCFVLMLACLDTFGSAPRWLMWLYAGISFTTLIVYAIDKSAAKKGAWRTPESTLHALALLGGWPGAVLAQQWLRHKTQKQSFRRVFFATAFVNVIALACLLWLGQN